LKVNLVMVVNLCDPVGHMPLLLRIHVEKLRFDCHLEKPVLSAPLLGQQLVLFLVVGDLKNRF
jgi:hypothetical protein